MPSATLPIVPGEVVVGEPKATTTARPLAAFTKLAPQVWLYDPATEDPIPSHHPTTIIFCAWMDAGPKHIDYYMRTYMKLYPQTRIVLSTINTTQ